MFASSFVATDVASTFRNTASNTRGPRNAAIVSKMSRIGKKPIEVPDKVKVTLNGNTVVVKVRRTRNIASSELYICISSSLALAILMLEEGRTFFDKSLPPKGSSRV
jgi:hypothetical protein